MGMDELKGLSLKGSRHSDDAVLISRSEEEKWVTDKLNEYRLPITIIGPRQAGKSTFLKQLQRKFKQDGVETAYVTLEGLAAYDKTSLEENIWSVISEQLAQQITIFGNPEAHGSNAKVSSNDVFNKLSSLEHSSSPIIFFDEFTYVAVNTGWFSSLRSFVESSRGSSVRIVLADRSHPTQYPSNGLSPFNVTDVVHLKDFSSEAAYSFLFKCAEINNVTISLEDANQLYEITNGQAFLMQVAAYRLISEVLANKRNSPSNDDLCKIIDSMYDDASGTSLEIYKTFADYLENGGHNNIRVDRVVKQVLSDIVSGYPVKFDEGGNTGKLYSLGFVVPTVHEIKWNQWVLGGKAVIRNKLYKAYLEYHSSLLE